MTRGERDYWNQRIKEEEKIKKQNEEAMEVLSEIGVYKEDWKKHLEESRARGTCAEISRDIHESLESARRYNRWAIIFSLIAIGIKLCSLAMTVMKLYG